jgi:SdrD B-like domain
MISRTTVLRGLVTSTALALLAGWWSMSARAQSAPSPQSFTFLSNGFTQELTGVTQMPPDSDGFATILGGIAFAPDGDVWSADCVFSGTRLHRFDKDATLGAIHGTTSLHPESMVVQTQGGCGLTNHPDGFIYSNSLDGVWKLDASTGLPVGNHPVGPRGDALGITVDPQTNHLVYVGADCHPTALSMLYPPVPPPTTCTLYDLDPATGVVTNFAMTSHDDLPFVDGIYFEPEGNFLFATNRGQEEGDNFLTILRRPTGPVSTPGTAQIVRAIPMSSEPDGVSFHASTPKFVVTNDETNGTMTRFDFQNDDYTAPLAQITVSTFASGGFRGDLTTVGPDGCIYATQGRFFVADDHGTRYDDGTETTEDSIVKICQAGGGGFAIAPGVPALATAPGSISGTIYIDLNRNQVHDAGEPGIPGVTVSLAGDASTAVVSGADGTYTFPSLPAGSFSVSSPSTAAGLQLFTPSPLGMTLAAGENKQGVDFGYVPGSVSGYAYVDLDRNGFKDVGEPGIPGVVITLAGPTGGTATTAADGSYRFGMVTAGDYTDSAPSTAAGKAIDTPSTLMFTVAAGQDLSDKNFGYVPGSLSGFAYVDSNHNGLKDVGEPGIAGVVISLAGSPGGTATTVADGSYSFANLDAGAYSVSAPAIASGKGLVTPSPLNPSVTAGQNTPDVNFGYLAGGISGTVFSDTNGNGVQDSGETGIPGVIVTGPNGQTTTTDSNGTFSFTDVPPGTYTISTPVTPTTTVTVTGGQTTSGTNLGHAVGSLSGFAYVDSNRNGVKDANEAGIGGVVMTGPGGTQTTAADGSYSFLNLDTGTYTVSAPATAIGLALVTESPLNPSVTAPNNTPDVNFGYVGGSVSGTVFTDTNHNGVQDSGETGIPGVTVTGPNGQTTTTDSSGSFTFTNVPAGTYTISTPVTPATTVTEGAGQTTTGVNLAHPVGSLSGFAYVDSNRNGVKDASEAGIGGVVMTGPGGTRTTAADGSYSFLNLDTGTYTVSAPVSASGLALVTPSPLNPSVTAPNNTPNVNFGYAGGSISGTVFTDTNHNGVQDAGETGIPGVTVTGPNGQTTTTDSSGTFTFTNVPAGTYPISTPVTPSTTVTEGLSQTTTGVNLAHAVGSLSGFAYEDSNRNGVKDAGEAGIGGVVITGPGGTRTTAADGSYSFLNLDSGTYSVSAPETASGLDLVTPSPLNPSVAAPNNTPNVNFGYALAVCPAPPTANKSNFNATPIAAGNVIWFNSNLKLSGLGSGTTHVFLDGATVQFVSNGVSYNLPVPSAMITISSSATCASTTFNQAMNRWETVVPLSQASQDVFLAGVAFTVPAGFVSGINPVTWTAGSFSTDRPSVTATWKWGAAVYTNFTTDYSAVGVKPAEGNTCLYLNADHAGTPENFKPFVTGGARGGGGSNFTGSWSGTVSFKPICP